MKDNIFIEKMWMHIDYNEIYGTVYTSYPDINTRYWSDSTGCNQCCGDNYAKTRG